MVGFAEMVEVASRYDTAVSRAMLRALGAAPPARRAPRRRRRRGGRYAALRECFANLGSPMDGRA